MIPYRSSESEFSVGNLAEKTFFLDFDRKIISGTVSGIEAAAQAARLILETERYAHIIYSNRYGTELAGLIGKQPDYICSELKRRVSEALKQDDRINDVTNFGFERIENKVKMSFTVKTKYGDVKADKEADL